MPYCSYDTVQSRTVGYVARGETKDGCQGWRHGWLVQTVHAKTVEQLDCTSMWARGAGELQLAGFFITIGHPLTQPESALEAIKLRRQKGLSMIGLHAEIAPTAQLHDIARSVQDRPSVTSLQEKAAALGWRGLKGEDFEYAVQLLDCGHPLPVVLERLLKLATDV